VRGGVVDHEEAEFFAHGVGEAEVVAGLPAAGRAAG